MLQRIPHMTRLALVAPIVMATTALVFYALTTSAGPAALTFTVNSTADVPGPPGDTMCETALGDNICTLRAAIMAANHVPGGSASIRVPDGLYRLTIPPSGTDDEASGDLNITAGMDISGAGPGLTVIDGNGGVITDHVLSIASGVTAIISGVTIQSGRSSGDGGGIANSGTLTLSQSTVQANLSLNAPNGGGGIANAGTLHLVDSTVFGNVLNGSAINLGGGGGIFSSGSLSLDHSEVIRNTFSGFGGTLGGVGGGGIFSSGALRLDHSIVMSNTLEGSGGLSVLLFGGGILNYSGTLTMSASSVIANQSLKHGVGGGIANFMGAFLLTDSTVGDNNADTVGGGIYNFKASAEVAGSTVKGNTTAGDGGGIFNRFGTASVVNSTMSSNIAALDGGGIKNSGDSASTLNLFNVTVAFNVAGPNQTGGGAANDAGAVFNLANTLFDGNVHATSVFPFHAFDDCSGEFTSFGYNLLSTTAGCTLTSTLTGNLTNVHALLGPLRNNGGATETHALQPGSPAIDAGHPGTMLVPNGCRDGLGALLSTDQRGFHRPANGGTSLRCDIGAYEFYRFGLSLPLIER